MAPPTWKELLTRAPLVTECDAYYKNFHVTDIAVCGVEDDKERQILVDPSAGAVHFPDVKEVSPTTTFLNIDDPLSCRILTTEGGFVYEREGYRNDGTTAPMGMGVMHLCRSEKPVVNASGKIGYEVYVSHNSVIDNQPSQPAALRPVIFEFRPEEIMAIVHGLRTESGVAFRIPNDHYQINPADHSQLSLMPNLKTLEAIIEGVQRKDSLIRPDRREAMVNALKKFIQLEIQQDDAGKIPPWLLTVLGVVGGTLATIPVMVWMQKRNEGLMREMREEGVKYDITKVYRDRTAEFKAGGSAAIETKGQERYIREIRTGLNRGGYPHILISGPSGSGKTHSVETVARMIINGQLETRLPSGIRYVQVDLGKMVTEAGAWQNGVRTVLGRTLDALGKQPTLVHFLETDRLANAGSEGNRALNLLPELYAITEQKTPRDRNLFIIADSTRYQTIYEAAPDLARRMHFTEIIPHTPDVIRGSIDNGLTLRRNDVRIPIRERFARIHFSRGALDAIAALGEYKDGAPPSSHLALLDALAEEADNAHPTGQFTVEQEHVLRAVARDTRKTIESVRTEFARRMAPGGFEGNRVIQEALLESFYREYPEPRGGKLNPLNLPPEAAGAGVSIFSDAASNSVQSVVASTADKPAAAVRLTEIFTNKTFADQIRTYYPDLKNPKFEKYVNAMANVARGRWLAALEASDPDHPPLMIVKNVALPREDFVEAALRDLVVAMDQRQHPQVLELRLIADKGGVSPGRIEAYPTSLLETGRRAFAEVPSAPRVEVHSSNGVAAEPGRREDPYQSFLKETGLAENSAPQDIVVKLMGSGQYPNVLKDFLGLMHDPQFDAYSPEEQIELAHRLVRAHVGESDAQKRPEWREIAESFHQEVLAGKSEAQGRQEAVNRIEKSVEERRKEREEEKRKSGRP